MINKLKKFMFRFSFGTKKAFDPYYQRRTSANDDLLNKAMKKTDKQLDKMFKLENPDGSRDKRDKR